MCNQTRSQLWALRSELKSGGEPDYASNAAGIFVAEPVYQAPFDVADTSEESCCADIAKQACGCLPCNGAIDDPVWHPQAAHIMPPFGVPGLT